MSGRVPDWTPRGWGDTDDPEPVLSPEVPQVDEADNPIVAVLLDAAGDVISCVRERRTVPFGFRSRSTPTGRR